MPEWSTLLEQAPPNAVPAPNPTAAPPAAAPVAPQGTTTAPAPGSDEAIADYEARKFTGEDSGEGYSINEWGQAFVPGPEPFFIDPETMQRIPDPGNPELAGSLPVEGTPTGAPPVAPTGAAPPVPPVTGPVAPTGAVPTTGPTMPPAIDPIQLIRLLLALKQGGPWGGALNGAT